ncbi:MAG: nucleotide sugar dehydrogenase [Acidobacteriota bacterium]
MFEGKLSVVGLGKLGAVMAAVMADKGFSVVGVDLNPATVQAVNDGLAPVQEPLLDDYIRRNRSRLTATTDIEAAVRETDATFIIVPTPSGPEGTFLVDYVLNACRGIARALRAKNTYHLVIVSSTVMPGQTGGSVLPLLEELSGKRCGVEFGLCYNPEFIALGSVVRDMLKPDMLLIGESDSKAGDLLESIYRRVCETNPPAARMNFVNAELSKLSVNTYVTTKISYANMLAAVCEQLPGADVDVVTSAIGLDSRIGVKYLKGALSYGGPCFPRDNIAFSALARKLGAEATLAEATHATNRRHTERLGELVVDLLDGAGSVAILGLSYKPGTAVVEESAGVALATYLAERSVPVTVYDPQAIPNARAELGDSVVYAGSVPAAIDGASVVLVLTAWDEFRALRPADFERPNGRVILVDCWRLFKDKGFDDVCTYLILGSGSSRTRTRRTANAVSAHAGSLEHARG